MVDINVTVNVAKIWAIVGKSLPHAQDTSDKPIVES